MAVFSGSMATRGGYPQRVGGVIVPCSGPATVEDFRSSYGRGHKGAKKMYQEVKRGRAIERQKRALERETYVRAVGSLLVVVTPKAPLVDFMPKAKEK